MTIKGMISNPVLNETKLGLFLDKPHQKESDTTSLLQRPSLKPRQNLKSFVHQPLMKRKSTSEPMIHYNGPCETLDQFPEEKYQWIASESFDIEDQAINPLEDYPKSIVLRKPQHINASSFEHCNTQRPKSKGTFYIRVLQANNSYSSKAYPIKPSITVEDEVFNGSFTGQKYGKVRTQTTMDEIFLIDFYKETTVNLSIYSHTKNRLGSISSHFKKTEICIGSCDFKIDLKSSEKKVERITMRNGDTEEQYQVLVIYGTFLDKSVMTLLQNDIVYKGYITVYTKGKSIPRWNRYWATLSPKGFVLYDFEYKEKRKEIYKVPLVSLIKVFHPPIDDDERLVDVGSLGLALQFSEQEECSPEVLENRMYILPDDQKSYKEWEAAFTQIADLIQEFRLDTRFDATRLDNKVVSISSKFLW